MASEKRKHVRVEHRGSIRFVTEGRSIEGSSINISRNGMQVVVNLPESHETIRSIAFELPTAGGDIRVPCRLVRNDPGGPAGERTLGIEFQHEAETQMLVIERYIQDAVARTAESRQLPRAACRISDVVADLPGVRPLSVDNLSADGLLLRFTGELRAGDDIELSVTPAIDRRPLRLRGSVVYVIDNAFHDTRTAGIRLRPAGETDTNRLRNLVLALSSHGAFRSMVSHLEDGAAGAGFRIDDAGAIRAVVASARAAGVPLSLIVEDHPTVKECLVDSLAAGRFELRTADDRASTEELRGRAAHVGLALDGESYYFRTRVADASGGQLLLDLPASVFRSDKRSSGRSAPRVGARVRLTIEDLQGAPREADGTILDVSARGFLCEVPASSAAAVGRGAQVRYRSDADAPGDGHGEVRHVRHVATRDGDAVRLGVETGVARGSPRKSRIGEEAWQRGRPYRPGAFAPPAGTLESTLVSYRDASGRLMRALVTATGPDATAPVVVIPSAYGRRKEAYAGLVATLVDNFRRLGQPLVTVRYDGINRPGESHNDTPNPRRGYEMLSYRISQGLEDLAATLSWVADNPHFRADGVVLLTFSMSALEARRYLATRPDAGVLLWISCMGVPCAQSSLRAILGGVDIVSNQRLGIPNGIMGVLGHLVDTGVLARDLLDSRYAGIADAREDMARISAPVLWISGQHDRWVDPAEVEDLMSVSAPGRREIIEVPSGHNLHTSDDAIQTYKLIAAELVRELHGERVDPCDPDKDRMVALISAERERLADRTVLSAEEYWRGYLVGSERNPDGYDFYARLPEFRRFLDDEVRLLELGEREAVADLGCGTGLFLESLLLELARRPVASPRYRVRAFDLVPEALDRARARTARLLGAHPALRNVDLSFERADLQPNPLLPLALLVERPDLGLGSLRRKVSGLTDEILDRLAGSGLPAAEALARGEHPAAAAMAALRAALGPREMDALQDLAKAARLVRGTLSARDLRYDRRDVPAGVPRASDLDLRLLSFGDASPPGEPLLAERSCTRIVASLLVSYLRNPEYLVAACRRALEPGGMLLISSMRPDSDISTIFTNCTKALWNLEDADLPAGETPGIAGALAMLNEAASLLELEENGHFRFYTGEELASLLAEAGFADIRVCPSLGAPAQAAVATGRRID